MGSNFQRLPYELPRYALDALRLQLADAALGRFYDLQTLYPRVPAYGSRLTSM